MPETFALGAAMILLLLRMNSLASGWEGMRIATVSSPPVALAGTVFFLGNITVKGPGQNSSMIFLASGLTSLAISSTCFISTI